VTTVPLDDPAEAPAGADDTGAADAGARTSVADRVKNVPRGDDVLPEDEWIDAPWLHPIREWEARGHRWLPGISYPIVLWVFWRVCHLVLTMWHSDPNHNWSVMWNNVRDSAFFYDGERYMQITKQGYALPHLEMPNTAFFPGVSWLAWPVLRITHNEAFTGHLIASVTGLAAFIAVWGVTRSWKGDEIGRKAVWLLALFPSSLFLWAFYSEGLFIALGAGVVWADRRNKHGLAALLLIALSTTRSVAVLIPIVIILARIIRHKRLDKWCFIYGGAGVAGMLPVLYMMDHYTGDPLAFMRVQKDWGRALSYPWTTVWDGLQNLWPQPETIMVPALVARNFDLWCLLIIAFGLGYLAFARRKEGFPMESWMIGVALIALPLCSTSLASFNRFVLADWVIYPAYASLGHRLPPWWRRAFWTVVIVALLITTYHMVGRFAVDRFIG
jgi:hypothetical protein